MVDKIQKRRMEEMFRQAEETQAAAKDMAKRMAALEEKIQTNEELQAFYDEIVEEVGL